MPPQLLLIDDDRDLCAMLEELLAGEGFGVASAHSGPAALAHVEQHRVDLAVLDVMLPGMSGFDVLRTLRRRSALPVLMLTARGEAVDRIVGLEVGADDYLAKPFHPRELIARIRAILRRTASRGGGRTDDDFTMDDLRIVPTELRAYRDKTEIPLSPRDVKVLRLLFDRRGKVIDRNTLADEVWGVDYFPESRALDQHISQLRKRIEKDPSQPRLIRTVHGAGYRFE